MISKISLPFCGLLLTMTFMSSCKQMPSVHQPSTFRRYGVEHAHIHYVFSGDSRGVEDIVFDGWGAHEAEYSKYERLEEKGIHPFSTLKLTLGAEIYMCEIPRRECNHWRDPQLDSLYHLAPADTPTADKATADYLSNGFHKVGTAQVAGVTADVWKMNVAPSSLYLWRSVLVKRVTYTPGDSSILEAVSIDTTTRIDTTQFVVPPGFIVHNRPTPPGL